MSQYALDFTDPLIGWLTSRNPGETRSAFVQCWDAGYRVQLSERGWPCAEGDGPTLDDAVRHALNLQAKTAKGGPSK